MQPLFPGQTRTSTLMLFFSCANRNVGTPQSWFHTESDQNLGCPPQGRSSSPAGATSASPRRMCFLLDAPQTHGRQSSFRSLSPGSGQRCTRQDAGRTGRCQVSVQNPFGATNHNSCTFHMTLTSWVLSRFSWVGFLQGQSRLEPFLSPRAAVHECRSTPGPPTSAKTTAIALSHVICDCATSSQ